MLRRILRSRVAILGVCLPLAAAGCSSEKSRNPLSPDVAGPIAGVSITSPKPLEPANGKEITAGAQIDLVIENASTNGERPLWQQIEVATDQAFSAKVHSADRVALGQNGRTTYRLPSALTSGRAYFWRARALDGANTGPFSDGAMFKVVVPVVIEPPIPVSPVGDAVTPSRTPQLVARNTAVSGPAGTVIYSFQISTDPAFGAGVTVTFEVPRSGGETTTFQLPELPADTRFFWRAIGSDGTHTSPWSPTQGFKTPAPPPPPPVTPPPPPPPTNPPPTNPPPAPPDVDIKVSYHGDPYQVGGVVDWFFDVTNLSDRKTTSPIELIFPLPASVRPFMEPPWQGTGWHCTFLPGIMRCTHEGPLDAGRTTGITLWTEVTKVVTELTGTASVLAETDDNPSNNTGLAAIPVSGAGPVADLSLAFAGPRTAIVGQLVTFQATVTNDGPDLATDVTLSQYLPAGVAFDVVTTDAGECPRPRDRGVICSLGSLAPGASATVSLRGSMTSAAVPMRHSAHVSSRSVRDPDLTNNSRMLAAMVQVDADRDGMGDTWEGQMGLDAASNDAGADPDGDGRTNLQELQDGTHPRGYYTRFFAEGDTGTFFNTTFALLNADETYGARVLWRFLREGGSPTSHWQWIGSHTRGTLVTATDIALQGSFGTVIESDRPIVADRTMIWAAQGETRGYGAHAETSVAKPRTTWYLAEGATHSDIRVYYLLENPNRTTAAVEIQYLRPVPQAPVVRQYTVDPTSRLTIEVNAIPGLGSADVSGIITVTNDVPIIVERAMYRSAGGQLFAAGDASAGIPEPATAWFLAEGATGAFFDTFVLIANPSETAASVEATFLLPDGTTVVRPYDIAPRSRFTIYVDDVDPRLAATAVATRLVSTNGVPVIVERAMWWPGPTVSAQFWSEAHVSAGATEAGTQWALAEGEDGGWMQCQTYVLIANVSADAGTARVTLIFEDATTATRTLELRPSSRSTIDVAAEFPEARGRRFGAVVESVGASPVPLVVERAIYTSADGVFWSGGTGALGTRLR